MLALAGAALVPGATLPPGRTIAAPALPPALPSSFRHGLSSFGDLRVGPDATHFAYVRPDAPKGGTFSQTVAQTLYNQAFESFDSLHIYVLKGNGAAGLQLTDATLMARAYDEPDAVYAYAAAGVEVSADRLVHRFAMRPGLTFHDGSLLTAEDVAWTLRTLKAHGHPSIAEPLRAMASAEAENGLTARITLAPGHGRDLALFVARLPILSRAWWQGRDFEASTLERPLGSGPYRVSKVEVGSAIELARVEGWWGEALPCQAGQNNFSTLRWEYYRDRDVAFEAFKARQTLFRQEFTARVWSTGYGFPAARDGRVRRETLPDRTPSGAQGWVLNTRRPSFRDPRVRQALGMAFDFEWTNKALMFGSYRRTASYFENSVLAATGLPGPDELALLEPHRAALSPEVFGPAVTPPVSDGSGQDRGLLRQATRLLAEAGWRIRDGACRNEAGTVLALEILDDEPGLEPHASGFLQNLRRLGIQASFRLVDSAQYQLRLNTFDFDATARRPTLEATPGEELRDLFASSAAARPGSGNLAGIADPVVDALVDAALAVTSRDALVTACRALDRVLRAGRYWVPHWYRDTYLLAYWDVFGRPPAPPAYDLGAPALWWSTA